MTHTEKKHRIIFIDLLRTFAVLQMVQGHTVDALLGNSFRDLDSPVYAVWLFMRGMTAPIFLFTAGSVFTYLFRLNKESYLKNPRVSKGFKRVLLLVSLGYLLKYPTYTIVDFSEVTAKSWNLFISIDVLQLIGFGLLFILILAFITEKLKLNDYYFFGMIGSAFFILSIFTENINWLNYFPEPIAAYFYSRTGSLFPLFPWAGYVICGGVLGSYLANHPLVFKTTRFSYIVSTAAAVFMLTAFVLNDLIPFPVGNIHPWNETLSTITFRMGFVLLLTGVVSLISIKIENIPKIFILLGRNTLLIYVVHLMIIYGSAWNPGLFLFFGESLTPLPTIVTAVLMVSAMIIMVFVLNKFKFKNKQLVT